MFHSVLYTVEGAVARITLNRPEKRNALNGELVGELRQAFAEAEADRGVKAVLLNGAGKDFCSGADLAALERIRDAGVMENLADARQIAEVFLAIRNSSRPVVAAVEGRALAGGCGLATACDIVLASESAQFGYPEVNIGFIPAMVMAILRRSVSEKAAFELIVTGDLVPAGRARELGVIQQVFPDGEFEAAASRYVARLARKSASALALSKRLLYHMDAMTFEAAIEAGVEANAIARMTDDCRAGLQAFLKS